MNITLSIDERVAEAAREAARKMGKSLNQVVREHLEQLAGNARVAGDLAAFEQRCLNAQGRLSGWQFDRDDANAR